MHARNPRLPAIDGLRGASVLLVMASHLLGDAGYHWVPGGLGVMVFFVISGFVITRMLLTQAAQGPIALGPFYLRRFFRLTPALLVYVLTCDLLLQVCGVELPWSAIGAALFYYANYFNLFAPTVVLGPDAIVSPLAVVWSLAVEEHFYLVFPLVLLALLHKPRRLEQALLGFMVASLLWRCVLVFGIGLEQMPNDRIFMASDTRLDSIAFGCWLGAAMHRAQRPGEARVKRLVDALGQPAMVAAGLVLLFVTLVVRQEAWRETLRYSLQGVALLPLMCALATRGRPLGGLRALLESRPMLFFGAISYSLYLYHFLAITLANLLWPGVSPWLRLSMAAALGLGMAVLSYLLIETPLRRSGARWADELQRRRQGGLPHAAT
ncbi:MAG TPA: acyltransferase [Methylibium sp.]|uniref:acyltransferase family protein n=1 Tax=Methylibium sp. TaxID=2067992 RepID=UPI002DBA3FA4|nr:acyltransferase [Methylibium sp.]HEU4460630.1 acyltransferase [Methylibium sp.]